MTRDYDGALQNVEEGLRRAPQSAFGYFLLGSIDKQTGKLPEAEHALRQALALDPQMSRIRLELVNIYLIQEKKIEAREELRGFLKDSPNDPLVPKARAVLAKLDASSK
jgi:Tfp pilus assembly protein PilF